MARSRALANGWPMVPPAYHTVLNAGIDLPPGTLLDANFVTDKYFDITSGPMSFLQMFPDFQRNSESLDTDPVTGETTIIPSGKPALGKSGLAVCAQRTNANIDTEFTLGKTGGLVIPSLPWIYDYYDSTWLRGTDPGPSLNVFGYSNEPTRGQAKAGLHIDGVPLRNGGVAVYPQRDEYPSIAAVAGEIWTSVLPIRVAGWPLGNIQPNVGIVENQPGAIYRADSKQLVSLDGSPLGTKRFSHTRTLTDALTGFNQGFEVLGMLANNRVHIDIEFGRQTLSESRYPLPIDIRTQGAPYTREADRVRNNSVASWFTSLPLLVVIKGRAPLGIDPTRNQFLFHLTDVSGNNAIVLLRTTSRQISAFVVTGGVVQADRTGNFVVPDGADFGVAAYFANGNVRISVSGAAVQTDTDTPNGMPTGMTRFAVGAEQGTAQHFDSHIWSVNLRQVSPPADAEMRALAVAA